MCGEQQGWRGKILFRWDLQMFDEVSPHHLTVLGLGGVKAEHFVVKNLCGQ